MKTLTVNNNGFTCCSTCKQMVKNGSIHTCSPQKIEFAPLMPTYAGSWVIGGNWHINVIQKPTDEHIKNTEVLLGWKWKDV